MMFPKIDLAALQSVLKTIVLFDSIGIAVRKNEIEHFLLESTASIEGIEISLSILEDLEIIKFEASKYSLFARDVHELNAEHSEYKLNGFQKFVLKSFASISFIRGIYHLNVPGLNEAMVLDVSGLNNPNLAKRYCKITSAILGKKVLFVSRFAKIKNDTIFHSIALAGMLPVYNPFGLEKLIRRNSESIIKFPNRVVDNTESIKPFVKSKRKKSNKPVFNASGANDLEFFTQISIFVENNSIDIDWEKNQTIYRQWLLPKLSKLNRKYQLV